MKSKSDISPEEEEQALLKNAEQWNACNPSFAKDIQYWRDKLEQAKAEGYKSEKCSCDCVFLAFHHFTSCQDSECPMSDGVSILDRLKG